MQGLLQLLNGLWILLLVYIQERFQSSWHYWEIHCCWIDFHAYFDLCPRLSVGYHCHHWQVKSRLGSIWDHKPPVCVLQIYKSGYSPSECRCGESSNQETHYWAYLDRSMLASQFFQSAGLRKSWYIKMFQHPIVKFAYLRFQQPIYCQRFLLIDISNNQAWVSKLLKLWSHHRPRCQIVGWYLQIHHATNIMIMLD